MQKQELRFTLLFFFVAIALVVSAVVVSTRNQNEKGTTLGKEQRMQQTQQQVAPANVLSTVASHNTAQDCWVVVDGSAYNVTGYIDQHPGGAAIIKSLCGKDATQAFQSRGGKGPHPSSAMQLLAPMKLEIP